MNLILFDFELAKMKEEKTPRRLNSSGTNKDICKGKLYPHRDICPLCYREEIAGVEKETFRSRSVILRYLYAVYTADKIV